MIVCNRSSAASPQKGSWQSQRRGSVASSERFTQRTFAKIIKLPARGAGVRWTPLPQAEALTEPVGENAPFARMCAPVLAIQNLCSLFLRILQPRIATAFQSPISTIPFFLSHNVKIGRKYA